MVGFVLAFFVLQKSQGSGLAHFFSTLFTPHMQFYCFLVGIYILTSCGNHLEENKKTYELELIQYHQEYHYLKTLVSQRDNLSEAYSDTLSVQIQKETNDMLHFLDAAENYLLEKSSCLNPMKVDSDNLSEDYLVKIHNFETAHKILFDKENSYNVFNIRDRLNQYTSRLIEYSRPPLSKCFFIALSTENKRTRDDHIASWEDITFGHLPLIDVLRELQFLKKEIVVVEWQVVELNRL